MVFTAVGSNNQTVWGAQTKAWSGNERVVKPLTYADGKYIQSLTVNDKTNAANWSVQTEPKQAGSIVFGDREFKFTSIPKILNGAEWVQTACDSKKYAGEEASFTAGADISVFVALDTRITDVPAWLTDWQKTADTFTDDGNPAVTYQLYKKDFTAGQTVTLGALNQANCVNYTVAVSAQQAYSIRGDVNSDGKCDIADVTALRDWLITESNTLADWQAGDLDENGRLNAVDLTLLKRLVMSTPVPGGQPTALNVSKLTNPFAGNITLLLLYME